ncbi:hypothetical protein GACE_2300 [Geoglobus acetivorans]|uniref:Uncharacterized protein n=1 Tax=Geoglobus acetivorans TaxID=565033 RepID=A0A0A7GGX5_GEOAI|nr:hypothetical protein GACE_2300 [Geoglobus acetivorans]
MVNFLETAKNEKGAWGIFNWTATWGKLEFKSPSEERKKQDY